MRGLQQDVLGVRSDLTVQAAHDAGDAENARATLAVGRIGDQQVLDAQVVFLAVERGELLAFGRATHHDRPFDLVKVVGVHRLAKVQHHVVRHIHGEGDRTHARADKTAAHPVRRVIRRVEPVDGAGDVAVAAGDAVNRVVVVDDDLDVAGDAGLRRGSGGGALVELGHRIDELRAGGMMVFAGHATVRERIAAIRGDVDFQDRLVEVQQVHRVVAGLERLVFLRREAVVAQQDDAFVAVAQAELALRGAHAVGNVAVGLARFDPEIAGQHCARQGHDDLLAGGHVRGAADDAARHLLAVLVDRVVRGADVDMTPVDGLAVLLRFRRRVDDISDDDRTGDLGGVDLLLLKTDPDQVLGQLLVGEVRRNLDVLLEPINVNHRHGLLTPPSQTVR